MAPSRTTFKVGTSSRFTPMRYGRRRGLSARRVADRIAALIVGVDDELEATVLARLANEADRLARAASGERGWAK